MTIRNDELATLFEEMADLLEAMDVEYKPVAYRRAAEQIHEHPENVAGIAREEGVEGVKTINRVGDAIASKVVEYTEQGEIAELEELRAELPVDMEGLTSVEGVGPKTVGTLYEQLGIQTLADLETAARAEEIQEVKGFGPKTEENILSNIDFARQSQERTLLGDALPLADSVRSYLQEEAPTERCVVAGSLRRRCSTIGDVDVLTASTDHAAVIGTFTEWPESERTIEAGTNKASIRSSGARIDLRVVDPSEFGGALQYFTGSKEHNIAIRNRALARDLKVNEYGVFDISAVEDPDAGQRVGERIGGETEAEIYSALDLPLIPPELREDRGEIEAAESGTLPDLITNGDVRGDLHVHTEFSDGRASIQEMVTAAEERGYEYLCITDHATGPGMVGGVGLDDEQLEQQLSEIRAVDDDAEIDVFAGVEANIDANGGISVGDDLLERLDCVVASPHAALSGDGTDRLITAIEHPSVNIIGHPTGRQLNQRPGLDIDPSEIARSAARAGTALEINANPIRLDLRGAIVQIAVREGAPIAIDTDAHRPSGFDYVRYGVDTARRGWAESADVINTWKSDDLRTYFKG